MPSADPVRRREAARLAALTRWSKERDRQAATRAANAGLRAKYDPGPDIPEPQRSKMIDAGIQAHMLRMRLARKTPGPEAAAKAVNDAP